MTDAAITTAEPPAVIATLQPFEWMPSGHGVEIPALDITQAEVDASDVAHLAVCYMHGGEFERAAFCLERVHGGPPCADSTVLLSGSGFSSACVVDIESKSHDGGVVCLLPLVPAGITLADVKVTSGVLASEDKSVRYPPSVWPSIELCIWAHARLLAGERSATARRLASGDPIKGPIVAEALASHAATQPDPSAGAARAPVNAASGAVVSALLPLWQRNQLDPPAATSLGAALRQAGRVQLARAVLASAACSMPLLWPAWEELSHTVRTPTDIPKLTTSHWAAHLFLSRVMRRCGRGAGALAAVLAAVAPNPAATTVAPSSSSSSSSASAASAAAVSSSSSFQASTSVAEARPAVLLAGIALAPPHRLETGQALKRLRRLTDAAEIFSALHADDPFNLASAAPLSDCLFVLGRRAELAALAYRVHATARHRPETAMVLANHCALKGEHERAVVHLKRALRADPTSATAWTLLGHECLEAKNGAAAVEAYRRALDVDPQDFRAWYGVGQAHELFGLRLRAADAYRRAVALQPTDGRMWTALGLCYMSRGELSLAAACLRRASVCQDQDGRAESALEQVVMDSAAHTSRVLGASSHTETRRLGAVAAEWRALGATLTAGIKDAGPPAELSAITRQRVAGLLERGRRLLEQGAAPDALAMAQAAVALLGTKIPKDVHSATVSPASSVESGLASVSAEGYRESEALRTAAASLYTDTSKAVKSTLVPSVTRSGVGAPGRHTGAAAASASSPSAGEEDESGSIYNEYADADWGVGDLSEVGMQLGDEDDEEMDVSSFDMEQD